MCRTSRPPLAFNAMLNGMGRSDHQPTTITSTRPRILSARDGRGKGHGQRVDMQRVDMQRHDNESILAAVACQHHARCNGRRSKTAGIWRENVTSCAMPRPDGRLGSACTARRSMHVNSSTQLQLLLSSSLFFYNGDSKLLPNNCIRVVELKAC